MPFLYIKLTFAERLRRALRAFQVKQLPRYTGIELAVGYISLTAEPPAGEQVRRYTEASTCGTAADLADIRGFLERKNGPISLPRL